jgi:DNA transformation protein
VRAAARPSERGSATSFREFVLDQLAGAGDLECRAMFGGHGLYRGEIFFGIIFRGRLYFRTDEASRAAYLERDMRPFRPRGKQGLGTYYEVPLEVLENARELERWAGAAVRTQRGGPKRR